jgi:hypothetical protein
VQARKGAFTVVYHHSVVAWASFFAFGICTITRDRLARRSARAVLQVYRCATCENLALVKIEQEVRPHTFLSRVLHNVNDGSESCPRGSSWGTRNSPPHLPQLSPQRGFRPSRAQSCLSQTFPFVSFERILGARVQQNSSLLRRLRAWVARLREGVGKSLRSRSRLAQTLSPSLSRSFGTVEPSQAQGCVGRHGGESRSGDDGEGDAFYGWAGWQSEALKQADSEERASYAIAQKPGVDCLKYGYGRLDGWIWHHYLQGWEKGVDG